MKATFLLLLAALSGAAGLAYEVAWTRGLGLVAGGSTRSMAVVLALFLGGMALGGWWGGARRVAARPPLRLCGVIELVLAGLGLGMPFLIPHLGEALAALARMGMPLDLGRALLLAGTLLPPAVLMGLTFPLWVRGLLGVRPGLAVGRAAALVAGVQVWGAALGAFVAGFLVIPALGYAAASFLGAGLDLLAGLLLLALARGARGSAPEPEEKPLDGGRTRPAMVLGFVLAGTASLGLQVVWTRSLVFFLDGLHHAFVAVLVAFLSGLGLGALAVAVCAPRVRQPGAWLAATQVLAGLGALATLLLVGRLGEPAMEAARSGAAWRFEVLWLSVLLLVIPAALLGTTLPLAAWLRVHQGGPVATGLGRAYGLTTLGNTLGALLVPLALVPLLSLRTTWAALPLLNGGAALLLARSGRGRAGALVLLILAGGVVTWTRLDPRPLILDSHVFRSRRGQDRVLLHAEDGRNCSVAVIRNARLGSTSLYTDTFAAAATGREYPYMRLLGHLPVLACSAPRRVLVICFGTGTTGGAVSLHPEVEELRLVDVEAAVFAVASRFRDVNHDVLSGRDGLRVEPVVEDGRLDLLLDDRGFDVITLEPLMPYTQGAVSFYTTEFYRLAAERLHAGGTLCQWIPVHAMPVDDYRSLVRTFLEVFPEGELYFFEQSSLLLARKAGPSPTADDLVRRAAHPAVAADLRAALVAGPLDLLAGRVARGDLVAPAVADAPLVTDDHPHVTFLRARPESYGFRLLRDTLELLVELAEKDRAEEPIPGSPTGLDEEQRARLADLRETRLGLLRARLADARWRTPGSGGRGADPQDPVLAALGRALVTDPDHLEGARLVGRRRFELARYLAARALSAGRPLEVLARLAPFRGFPEWDLSSDVLQAVALVAAGDGAGACQILDRVLATHPGDVRARVTRSVARSLDGDGRGAREDADAAEVRDRERAARERRFVESARAASRSGGFPPLTPLRNRLAEVVEGDPLESPARLQQAMSGLQGPGTAALRPLLARPHVAVLEDDESPPDALRRSARAAAVLGIGRVRGVLARRWREAPRGSPPAGTLLRALAALVPRDPELLSAIWKSEDPVARRLLAALASPRGDRALCRHLLPGLTDADEDVRLYTDRALRRHTGGSVGYDYQATPDERVAAAARWARTL